MFEHTSRVAHEPRYNVRFHCSNVRNGQYHLSVTVKSPDVPNAAYPGSDGIIFSAEWWSETQEPAPEIVRMFERLAAASQIPAPVSDATPLSAILNDPDSNRAIHEDDTVAELQTLAARAAIALDNVTLGKPYRYIDITEFARMARFRLASNIVDRAIVLAAHDVMQNQAYVNISSEADPVARTIAVCDELIRVVESSHVDIRRIRNLRGFCVDFARCLSTHVESPFRCKE
jgi:hypothetical protein